METIQNHIHKKLPAFSIELPYEYVAFRALLLISAILVAAYLYLVFNSVFNVIAQREADLASVALESDLGNLEANYFALSKDITANQASKLGLTPLSESSYVYRLSTVGMAPTSHNAI